MNYGAFYTVAIECEDLDDPRYGNVILTGTKVSSTATYVCDDGFLLIGNQLRKCLSNGLWSGEEPICKGRVFIKQKIIALISARYFELWCCKSCSH